MPATAQHRMRTSWGVLLLLAAAACGNDDSVAGQPDTTVASDAAGDSATGDLAPGDSAGGGDVQPSDITSCTSALDCPLPTAPCRAPSCQPGVGCVETTLPDGIVCNPGDPCILSGQCQAGICKPGAARDCDDSNPCTADSCDKGACLHAAIADKACDDGNPCTANDGCSGGVCAPGKAICNCANDDDCAALGGPCKGTWYCAKEGGAASCKINPATVVVCAPSTSPCLVHACDPATGACAAKPVADGLLIPCDDGNACSSGDVCKGGGCLPGADICGCKGDQDCAGKDDGDLCNGTMYCNKAAKPASCELNPATVVSCPSVDDTGCSNNVCEPKSGACKKVAQPDGKPCDDGSLCTSGEACKGGACQAEANTCECTADADCKAKDDGNLCNGTMYCDKSGSGGMAAVCKLNPATIVTCPKVDDTSCVANTCEPKAGTCAMQAKNEAKACDDGDPCTSGEVCTGGACKASAGANICGCTADLDCASKEDGNLCNGTLFCDKTAAPFACKVNPATVKTCSAAFDSVCAAAACDAATGGCNLQPRNNGMPCDDGNPCTQGDYCKLGQCAPGAPFCECQGDLDCASKDDGNWCNGTLYCDKASQPWKCAVQPTTVVKCPSVDDTLCRKALCQPKTGICELTPINQGIACDDGSACVIDEVCKNGACAGNAKICDDNIPCTADACDPATGCTHQLVVGLCDDGDVCTADVCDPKAPGASEVGCAHKKLTATPCDDGNLCTETDSCTLGVCGGKAKVCQDNQVCSDDGCDPKTGCTFAANTAPCKTDKPCQPLGVCAAGACVAEPAPMWTALVDGAAAELPLAVAAAGDGSAFVVGRSLKAGGKPEDAELWLARVGVGGDKTLWAKTMGGAGDDAALAVAALAVGDGKPTDAVKPGDVAAIIAGRRAAGSKGGADAWVLRIGADGSPAWQQHIGGGGADTALGVVAWGKGQAAFAGQLGSGDAGQAWLGRLDAYGTVLWSTAVTAAGTKAGAAWAIDRGVGPGGAEHFVVAGRRKDAKGVEGMFAARVDDEGVVQWQVELGVGKSGDSADGARAVRASGAGGLVAAGGSGKAGRLVHVDGSGKLMWDLGFGAAGGGRLAGLGAMHDGALWAVGTTKADAGAGKEVVWLLQVDLQGALLQQRTLQPAHAAALPALSTWGDGRMVVGAPTDKAAGDAVVELAARLQALDAFGHQSCDSQGACQAKSRADCDDANPCTHDGCAAELGCTHQVHSLPCEDGDICTLGEACKAGKCVGAKSACDDGNPCTKDACDLAKGCTHTAQDGPCDDGEPCSAGEACVAGVCQPGKLVDCDDGNVCTDDSCIKGKGCSHLANSSPCDTGSCTVQDQCAGTLCKTSGKLRYTTTYHGQAGDDVANSVAPMSDNGLLLAGTTWTKPDPDGILVRTDAVGKALWQSVAEGPKGCCGYNSHQSPSNDMILDAIETPFGVFAVGRSSICVDQAWAAMFDAQGKVVWSTPAIADDACGSGSHRGIFYAAATGNDGTWAAAGNNFHYPWGATQYVGYFARFNQNGGKVSHKTGMGFRYIFDLASRGGGGYFAAGDINGSSGVDGRIAALDSDGDPIWASSHVTGSGSSTADYDVLRRVAAMPDGGAAAIGHGGGTGVRQILLVRVDAAGKLLFSKTYGIAGDDTAGGLVAETSGALVLATTQYGTGAGDLRLYGIDPSGNVAWMRDHGGPKPQLAADLVRRADGSLALLSTSTAAGKAQPDLELMTLDPWGYAACKDAGACSAMSVPTCDDGNPCTSDTCAAATGCSHATAADGSPCAAGKVCTKGACGPAPK